MRIGLGFGEDGLDAASADRCLRLGGFTIGRLERAVDYVVETGFDVSLLRPEIVIDVIIDTVFRYKTGFRL